MPARRLRPRWIAATIATVVVIVAATIGATYYVKRDDPAIAAATSFATAWASNKLESVEFSNFSRADVVKDYAATAGDLALLTPAVRTGATKLAGDTATTTLHVSWRFPTGNWVYDTQIRTVEVNGTWKPEWRRSVVHPELGDKDKLLLDRLQPVRGDIYGINGEQLVTTRPVIEVGVERRNFENLEAEAQQLAALLDVDAGSLLERIRTAKEDAFVSVITLRREDYDAKRAQLQAIPATVFKEGTMPLAVDRQFASALLGRAGPVTEEIVKSSGGRYRAGELAGLSGLQQQYDRQLAGEPGTQVSVMTEDGTAKTELFTAPPRPGEPLRTTLDQRAQTAAENAIAGATKPTSFVAIKASTGEVIAVANGPEVAGVNRAFTGQYPPGSSFKVITSYALLKGGLSPDAIVECPPTATVDGREFKNAEDESLGAADFRTNFAHSCNTAFVALSPRVAGKALPDAAALFGIGAQWDSGTAAFSGSVPEPVTNVELAATAFGQGKVLMSPLSMAVVAAAVANGTPRTPKVITAKNAPPQPVLDEAVLQDLRALMHTVVASGTGEAARGVPGGEVFGKTGTAEFGNATPPQSHAWFIGYQGEIAFAAFVEGGEFGGEAAAPIAAKFLTNLARP